MTNRQRGQGMKGQERAVKRGKHDWTDGKRLLGRRKGGEERARGCEADGERWQCREKKREREREEAKDRKGEGLCLISGPGECLVWAKMEHGMFFNWPCSVEREGRGEVRKRWDRHRGEKKKRRRNDWTFVCLAVRAYEQAVVCAFAEKYVILVTLLQLAQVFLLLNNVV